MFASFEKFIIQYGAVGSEPAAEAHRRPAVPMRHDGRLPTVRRPHQDLLALRLGGTPVTGEVLDRDIHFMETNHRRMKSMNRI